MNAMSSESLCSQLLNGIICSSPAPVANENVDVIVVFKIEVGL